MSSTLISQYPLRRSSQPNRWSLGDTILVVIADRASSNRPSWTIGYQLTFQEVATEIRDWLTRNQLLRNGVPVTFRTRRDAQQAAVAALTVDPPRVSVTPALATLTQLQRGIYRHPDTAATVKRHRTGWLIDRPDGAKRQYVPSLREAQILLAGSRLQLTTH